MSNKDSEHHFKESAQHAAENAAKVYHTLEAHRTKELQQDVQGVLGRFRTWFKKETAILWRWYRTRSLGLKILYGLTIAPVLLVLVALGVILVKFGGPILLALAVTAKVIIVVTKVLFFIGYITYKLLKTILILYYLITRTRSGRKEKKRRWQVINDKTLPTETWDDSNAYETLRFQHAWKTLQIEKDGASYPVLFSYLRYAIEAQKAVFRHVKNDWRMYLTLWRSAHLQHVKQAWGALAIAAFKPHLLGHQWFNGQLLVLGDAQIEKIVVQEHAILVNLQIQWIDWTFTLKKSLRFLSIHRAHQQADWQITYPLTESASLVSDTPVPSTPG